MYNIDMHKIDTVIFDLDGTLLDTLEDLADSVNCTLEMFGFEQRSVSEIRNFVGNGISRLVELSIPDGKNNSSFEQVLKTLRRVYAENCCKKTKPFKGIMEFLALLKSKKYKIAVVSNKPDDQVKRLNELFFSDLISVAIGERPNVKRKPAPDTLEEALKELGSKKENAVYIGDSEVDIEAALNAGIFCISVDWGFRDKEWLFSHGAKVIISKPSDFWEL